MVGDVLGELFQRPDFRHLILGIRLGRFILAVSRGHHVNRIVNHTFPFLALNIGFHLSTGSALHPFDTAKIRCHTSENNSVERH